MTYLLSDAEDQNSLYTAHFLIGKKLTTLPPENIQPIPSTKKGII